MTDLLQRAERAPTGVLLLDDLHWAAPSTIALVRHLLGAGSDHRLCVLATYRDTEIDRAHALGALLADIHRGRGIERLALRGLDGHAIEELPAVGRELDDDARTLAAAVVERTAGNLFFVDQVLRHLVERGVLVQDAGRWTIQGSLDDVDLPEGVLDVVGRRFPACHRPPTRPSPSARWAGSRSGAGAERVPDAGTPDAVVDGLDEAVRPACWWRPAPGVAFAHAIVRDARRRRAHHRQTGPAASRPGDAILAVYADAPESAPPRSWPATSPRPPCSVTLPPWPGGRLPPPAPLPARPIIGPPSPCSNTRSRHRERRARRPSGAVRGGRRG